MADFKRTPVGAGDGNTYVIDKQWYVSEIAALRAELEQAKAERDSLQFRLDSALRARNIWTGNADIATKLVEAMATIARQREWIERAGHREECNSRLCVLCGSSAAWIARTDRYPRESHEFQPGPCSCGWEDLTKGGNANAI